MTIGQQQGMATADVLLQRAWRDIHAAAAHHSNRWDDAMQHFGHVEFGFGPPNPFFY